MPPLVRRALLYTLVVALLGATGQTSTQLLSRQDLVDNVAAGKFTWSGSAQVGSQQIVNRAFFTASVVTNGSCATGGASDKYQMTFGDMMACAATPPPSGTTIAATTDPCINSSGDWPTVSGTAAFAALTGAVGSCSSGNAAREQAPAAAGSQSFTIAQPLNGGATINSGTSIHVTAYLESFTQSYTDPGTTDCGSAGSFSATSSANVAILNASQTVVASIAVNDGAGAYESKTVGYTTPSAGVYYGAVIVTGVATATQTISENRNGGCRFISGQVSAAGFATNITASN